MYPGTIRNLIECLKDLPGIGEKSAERLAYSIVGFDKDKLDNFANTLINIKDNIRRCQSCNCITDMDKCYICNDDNRSDDTIFVVEKSKDIILFEKLGVYKGVYHVLNGLISPLDGIGPDEITISELLSRVDRENIKEIILALKPSIEGETTMQYIKKLLVDKNIKISKIATGVPIGTDMEYIDSLTLELAID